MKIKLERTFKTVEVYETVEFDPQNYPELEGMSNEEIIDYLNENIGEFTINGTDEVLIDHFMFDKDLQYDGTMDHEDVISIVND